MVLRLRPGIAERLTWSRAPGSYECSNCGRTIDERTNPLRFMGSRYAVFCDDCVEECFEREEGE